jgi:uronate dehydrogenase
MKKIVLTGAAGRLGSYLREPLTKLCDELLSSDIIDVGTLYPRESFLKADLSKLDQMTALLKGADMVVHFGAIGDEAPFDQILSFSKWCEARAICQLYSCGGHVSQN